MPPVIQILAERLIVARGAEYYDHFIALKNYLKAIDDDEFQSQVKEIDNREILGYLLATGLPWSRIWMIAIRGRELE